MAGPKNVALPAFIASFKEKRERKAITHEKTMSDSTFNFETRRGAEEFHFHCDVSTFSEWNKTKQNTANFFLLSFCSTLPTRESFIPSASYPLFGERTQR
jgi:hypothetical protein